MFARARPSPVAIASVPPTFAALPTHPFKFLSITRAARQTLTDVTISAKGVCGKRHYMEDRHRIIHNIVPGVHYIGVFDGHGGAEVAAACADIIADRVRHYLLSGSSFEVALSKSIADADETGFAEWGATDTQNVGSTALVALVTDDHIYVANVGDTEAYLLRGNTPFSLSRPHRPCERDERLRIERAGGFIACHATDKTARVQGILAITRALGDHALRPYVIAKPEVVSIRRSKRDRALVVATDGLWDVLAPEDAMRMTNEALDAMCTETNVTVAPDAADQASIIAALLVQAALKRRSADNVSVAVALFSPAAPPSSPSSATGGY